MFVKPYLKQNWTTGERYTIYKLVEGYRTNGQVTHRIIISLGRLDELETDDQKKLLGKRVEELLLNGGNTLKEYYADITASPVLITDKRKQPIELLKVQTTSNSDQYLWVKSHTKKMKEDGMKSLLSQRFEQGIQSLHEGVSKKGGTKKLNKVYERIGRLKQKYPSVHTAYNIIVCDDGNQRATSVSCKQIATGHGNSQSGVYFLRTNIMQVDEHTFWSIYNIIREVEYTFRVLKTDLDLRPIYHKSDQASMAHLHLGILAYWVVTTIRYQLKQNGIYAGWREITRRMNTQKCVTTSLVNNRQQTIAVRQCTEPTSNVKAIYDSLKYKYAPFTRKKSVVPPPEFSEK